MYISHELYESQTIYVIRKLRVPATASVACVAYVYESQFMSI